jgi:hypothetical protein
MATMLNIDRHIAISAGWIAGPAFGVAMMAAPEYFHLGPIPSGLLFRGGIVVFLLKIAAVVLVSPHEEGIQFGACRELLRLSAFATSKLRKIAKTAATLCTTQGL